MKEGWGGCTNDLSGLEYDFTSVISDEVRRCNEHYSV